MPNEELEVPFSEMLWLLAPQLRQELNQILSKHMKLGGEAFHSFANSTRLNTREQTNNFHDSDVRAAAAAAKHASKE